MKIVFYVPDSYFPSDTHPGDVAALRTRMTEAMQAAYPSATCIVSEHAHPEAKMPDEFRRVAFLVVSDDTADQAGIGSSCFDMWHAVANIPGYYSSAKTRQLVDWEGSYRSAQKRYDKLEETIKKLVRDGCNFYVGHPDYDVLVSLLRAPT